MADLVLALRPGWWVLRGWLLAQLLSGAHNRATWHGFIPSAGGNSLLGFLLLVCAIAASLWIGTRSVAWNVWPRRLSAAVGIVLAIWGVAELAKNVGGTEYSYLDSGSNAGYDDPLRSVQDVYAPREPPLEPKRSSSRPAPVSRNSPLTATGSPPH